MASCATSQTLSAMHRGDMKLFVRMYINHLDKNQTIDSHNMQEYVDSIVQYLESHGHTQVVETPEFMDTVLSAMDNLCDDREKRLRAAERDMRESECDIRAVAAQQQDISSQIDASNVLSDEEKAIAHSLNFKLQTEKLSKISAERGLKRAD